LDCYTTIASQNLVGGDGSYSVQIVKIYDYAMGYIQKALPLIKGKENNRHFCTTYLLLTNILNFTIDFAVVYEDSDAYDQSFVHHVLLFITTILSKHLDVSRIKEK
jgi:uncharacterized protein (UPF0332 family)